MDRRPADSAAVLFDMDGVLVDSEVYWHEFEDEFVFPVAVASGDPDADEITGMNYREIYEYLTDTYGTTLDREAFIDRYDARAETVYTERVDLMDGAPDLIEALRSAGYAVGIVTSAPRHWLGHVRERFDLGELDLVLSADDIDAPGKPDPAIYERAASELGVDPGACVVVEDSYNGVQAATRAGARCLAYRTAHNAETDLSAAASVVEGPEALRAALLG